MNIARRDRWLAINFAATIFVSAFLLFQVQPLVSKYILPWFGGSPAVWTTCMLFFQTLLFGGYAYAHLSQRFLRPRWQGLVHLGLIVAALLLLRVVPSESWKPVDSTHPVERILLLLAASVGVPYFVLSSTGPLIQAWFARSFPGKIPYRLYALSNVGSLLALLSYPFLFERLWDVPQQAGFWSWGFVVYAALCTYAAISVWMLLRKPTSTTAELPTEGEAAGLEVAPAAPDDVASEDTWWRKALWLALPAFASVTLLATTNHVSTDVAPVPFLWVAPLSLYLLTFIIAFDHSRWYRPAMFAVLTLVAIYLVAVAYCNGFKDIELINCGVVGKILNAGFDQWSRLRGQQSFSFKFSLDFKQYVGMNFVAMFGICMLCHGELVRLRPHPKHLTAYFLMIAAGGALGGATVTLLAPNIFRTFYEFDLALMAGYLLATVILVRTVYRFGIAADSAVRRRWLQWLRLAGGLLLLCVAGVALCDLPHYFDESSTRRELAVRNFFGTLSVLHQEADNIGGLAYALKHGSITHGVQFTDERRYKPTTYYSEDSGVGRTIGYFRQRSPKGGLRVGAVGLGTGTLAAYIDKGDSIRFYEINPDVIDIAESGQWFTYLEDSKLRGGEYQIELGDARLTLERELKGDQPQHFQVLVLDAFSGDAIPVHLLTEEAFRIYLDDLTDDGAIAVHISNRYLDLEPVVRGAAEKFDLRQVRIKNASDAHNAVNASDWIILTRNNKLADALEPSAVKPSDDRPPAVVWTDARSNLFDILK